MSIYVAFISLSDEMMVSPFYFRESNKAFKWILEILIKLDVKDAKRKMKKSMIIENKGMFFSVDGVICSIFKVGKHKKRVRECKICLGNEDDEEDSMEWSEMKCCEFPIHKECKKGVLSTQEECPYCKTCLVDPETKEPHGTMTISKLNYVHIPFKNKDTGVLTASFNLQGGKNDIGYYPPDSRNAYFPDNKEGNELVDWFIDGFKKGVLFRIGDSVTTGRKNVIVYGAAHQKTTISGPHGYPDDGYPVRAMNELALAGVMGPYKGKKADLPKGNHKVYDNR